MPEHRSIHPKHRARAGSRVAAFRGGFKLLELCLCVAIIGVVAAITIPMYAGSNARARVTSLASKLAADIEALRQDADAASSARSIVLTANNSRCRILDSAGENLRVVDLSPEPFRGFISQASLGGDSTLTFNGYGVADSGGTITVRSADYSCDITVADVSGKCTVGPPYQVAPLPADRTPDSGGLLGGLLDLLGGR